VSELRSMNRTGLALILALAATARLAHAAVAVQDDPLQAPECREALASLQAQEAAAPRPPVAPAGDRPYAITSCDPGGCWANDGSRLNRVGTTLLGRQGVCILHGTLLQCP
jgi:hypothetical protein